MKEPTLSTSALAKAMAALTEAVLRGDTEVLEGLLSPELSWVHGSGAADTKAVFVGAIRSGAVRCSQFEVEGVQTRIYGSTGLVTGLLRIEVENPTGRLAGMSRFCAVWSARPQPRLVLWQNTRLLPGA